MAKRILRSTALFHCTVCLEDKKEIQPRLVEGSVVCADCVTTAVVPLFLAALEHEHSYPPKWGQTRLDAADFASLLGDDFIDCYRRRELEYNTHISDRIYCQHKMLANKATPVGAKANPREMLAITPEDMQRLTNMTALGGTSMEALVIDCGAMVSGRRQRVGTMLRCYRCNGEHTCTQENATDHNLAAEGMVQGRDYQICPGCTKLIELREGCNHVVCLCDCSFCFICQAEVDDHPGQDHWTTRCPRFGHPSAPNSIFDHPVPEWYPMPRQQDELDLGTLQDLQTALIQRVRHSVENGAPFTLGEFLQEQLGAAVLRITPNRLEGLRHSLGGRIWPLQYTEVNRITNPVLDEIQNWRRRQPAGVYGEMFMYTLRSLPGDVLEISLYQAYRRRLEGHRAIHRATSRVVDEIGLERFRNELSLLAEMLDTYVDRTPLWLRQPISEQQLEHIRSDAAETEIRNLFRFDDPATANVAAGLQRILTDLPRRLLDNTHSMILLAGGDAGSRNLRSAAEIREIQTEYFDIISILESAPAGLFVDLPNLDEMRQEFYNAAGNVGAAEWTR